MKKICSWCNKVLDEGNGVTSVISHGICKECYEVVMKQFRKDHHEKAFTDRYVCNFK